MRALWVVVVVGCYHPTESPDQPCSDTGACPAGQRCDTSQSPPVCVVGDGGLVLGDASDAPPNTIDAPPGACTADSDCPDDVCVESTGACVAAANALYVAPNGDDTGPCTRQQPCGTVSGALAKLTDTQRTIKVADGNYTDAFLISKVAAIVISGEQSVAKNTTITQTQVGFGGMALDHVVEDVGTDLTIEGMTLTAAPKEAARVSGGGKLTLFATALTQSGGGLDCSGGNAVLIAATVSSNTGTGVSASSANGGGGSINIRRTLVLNNAGVGVSLSNVNYDVENTVIGLNAGGVTITGPKNTATFSFNTVGKNPSTATGPAGIVCNAAVTIDNTIIADNGTSPQISDTCTASFSLFSDVVPTAGTGNVAGGAAFVSAGTGNLHITAASAARNAADPQASLAVDLDGQARPQGNARDIGADEIP